MQVHELKVYRDTRQTEAWSCFTPPHSHAAGGPCTRPATRPHPHSGCSTNRCSTLPHCMEEGLTCAVYLPSLAPGPKHTVYKMQPQRNGKWEDIPPQFLSTTVVARTLLKLLTALFNSLAVAHVIILLYTSGRPHTIVLSNMFATVLVPIQSSPIVYICQTGKQTDTGRHTSSQTDRQTGRWA